MKNTIHFDLSTILGGMDIRYKIINLTILILIWFGYAMPTLVQSSNRDDIILGVFTTLILLPYIYIKSNEIIELLQKRKNE